MPKGVSPVAFCCNIFQRIGFANILNLIILNFELKTVPLQKKRSIMARSVSVNINMPQADFAFIRQLGKRMGWEVTNSTLKPATNQRKEPKIKMTEEEFYAKLDHSIATSSEDTMSVMLPSETGEQFLNRMLGAN